MISCENFSIDVSPSFVRFLPIRHIFKGNKESIAQDGFVDLDGIFFPIQFKMELSIPDISFFGSPVGQEGCIVFWIIDVKDVALDRPMKDILGVEGKIF